MKQQSISPAVAAGLIAIVVIVLAIVGWKVLGDHKTTGTADSAGGYKPSAPPPGYPTGASSGSPNASNYPGAGSNYPGSGGSSGRSGYPGGGSPGSGGYPGSGGR